MPALRHLIAASTIVVSFSMSPGILGATNQRINSLPVIQNDEQITWSFTDKTFEQAASIASQNSGISIDLRGVDGKTVLSRQIRAGNWLPAIEQLLKGYNYIGFYNRDGKLDKIYVTGLNGSADSSAQSSGKAIAYPQNQLSTTNDSKNHSKPSRLQALPADSVLAIQFSREFLLNLDPGAMIDFNLPGGTIQVTYDHTVNHTNGDKTWIGYVSNEGTEYRVILTFGSNGTIGRIITADNFYNIESASGSDWLIDYNASGLKSGSYENDSFLLGTKTSTTKPHQSLSKFSNYPDIQRPVPNPIPVDSAEVDTAAEAASLESSNALGDSELIDVMAIYTTGFADQRDAETRLNFLIAASNQAYIDSEIAIQLRIVHSQQLEYTDSNNNSVALTAMTAGEAPFENISSLREQYGADLVTLIRPFTYPAQVSCGTAWVLGANQGWLNGKNAFSVVSDGYHNGYYCSDYTFVHELSHNMGSVHDQANTSFSGIYAYSYGYGKEGVFGTIMSYLHPGVGVFSNPDINCAGYICGVDETQSTAANNALSLNNVASTVANFFPTKVAIPVVEETPQDPEDVAETPDPEVPPPTEETSLASGYDVNADGNADLFWQKGKQLTLDLMSGVSILETQSLLNLNDGAQAVSVSDFNGDAIPDLLIRNASAGSLRFRFGEGFEREPALNGIDSDWTIVATADLNGNGISDIILQHQKSLVFLAWFISDGQLTSYSRIYPHNNEWKIMHSADFDLDGKDDLFWYNPNTGKSLITLMSGAQVLKKIHLPALTTEWTPLSAGDFDGDGYPDMIWHNLSNGKLRLWKMASGTVQSDGNIATESDRRWRMVGASDINSDGIADLIWRHRYGRNRVMYIDGFNEPTVEFMGWVDATATPILK